MTHGRILSAASALTFILVGCGGGSGGGDSTPVVETTYNGLTSDAPINRESAAALVEFLPSEESSLPFFSPSPRQSQPTVSLRPVPKAFAALSSPGAHQKSVVRVEEALDCDSGFGEVRGSIDDVTYLGSYVMRFDECVDDNDRITGEIEVSWTKADPYYGDPIDITMKYNDLSGVNLDTSEEMIISGMVSASGMGTCDMLSVSDLIMQSSMPENSILMEEYRLRIECDYSLSTSYETEKYTYSGSIYIGDLGKIMVSSEDAIFALNVYDFDSPLGEMTLLADGSISIQNSTGSLVFEGLYQDDTSPAPREFLVKVMLDKGLDGELEVDMIIPAWWMASPDMMDMEDSDGDGMWRGWELAHGLDPTVADGALDSDNDGFTNLQEFVAHTHPMNQSDFPAEEE
ncbi:hypothetical protein EZV61_07050 [Corallincola luteus]|uniref:Lipoprotein n=1 Tax=Corallincola luteus TaxID=1775177 RepID=A0ABY2ALX9_9GAMM|nr:hypothetical protein [Corallincola luteus]TCI03946.1 hypothetical protein EZV61_07050 [Corallincola luteus]